MKPTERRPVQLPCEYIYHDRMSCIRQLFYLGFQGNYFIKNLASYRVMNKGGMHFVRSFRLTPEDLEKSDASFNKAAVVWEGEDVEYAINKSDWDKHQAGQEPPAA